VKKIFLTLWTIMIVGPALLSIDSLCAATNVHSFSVPNIDGNAVDLSQYKGKVLLIVNTASQCGYTPQYKPLEALYEKYRDQGFEVLAFPANNFKQQEPGSNEDIKNFCLLNYKTTFPLFAKSSVKGSDISPLYQYLTKESPFKGEITWNFNKFLVGPDGEVIARFESAVDPLAPELVNQLEAALAALKISGEAAPKSFQP